VEGHFLAGEKIGEHHDREIFTKVKDRQKGYAISPSKLHFYTKVGSLPIQHLYLGNGVASGNPQGVKIET